MSGKDQSQGQAGPSKTKSTGVSLAFPSSKEKEISRRRTNSSPKAECSPAGPEKRAWSTLPTTANKLFQEAKTQMEQSGNIRTTIKETVIKNLMGLYEIILQLHQSRSDMAARLQALGNAETSISNNAEILKEVKDQRRVAEETKIQMAALNTKLDSIQENLKVASYADVAAKPKKLEAVSTRTPTYSLIISSENVKDTSGDVIDKIRTVVDAKTSGIKVDRVRKAKDQKVILGCGSKEEAAKVSEKIKGAEVRLRVEEAKNRNPLIILKDVLTCNADRDILLAIRGQNRGLLQDLKDDETEMSVRYRRKTRNQHLNHVIMEVTPKLWKRVTEAGRLHIDLQRVVVQDQSPLVQCSRCLAFGHGRKLCTETVDLCAHCAGPHLRAECPDRMAGHPPSCRNCQASRNSRADHNAFDNECPVRKRWDILARSKVAYS